jgi:hypothetical protein
MGIAKRPSLALQLILRSPTLPARHGVVYKFDLIFL